MKPTPLLTRLARHTPWLPPLVLLTFVAMTLGHLTTINYDIDVTKQRRHGIPPEAAAALSQLPQAPVVTAYLGEENASRSAVAALVDRYRRHRKDLGLRFVPPREVPEQIRSGAVSPGEIRLELGERHARIKSLDDAGMVAAALTLARGYQPFVAVSIGHGERRALRQANHDLSNATAALSERGMRVVEHDFSGGQALPDNLSLVILASPRVELTQAATARLTEYLARGGDLLLLLDPQDVDVLTALGLPLRYQQGTVLDPQNQFRQIDDPGFIVADELGDHPSVAGFDLPILLPRTGAIRLAPDRRTTYSSTILIESSAHTWLERDPVAGQVGYDAGRDVKGPLALAVALERRSPVDAHLAQRLIVVGDGDFAANTYLSNGGNRWFFARLVEWLVDDDVNLGSNPTATRVLYPELDLVTSHPMAYLATAIFLFAIPGLCLLHAYRLGRSRRA